MSTNSDDPAFTPEPDADEPVEALAVRVPITLDELAARKREAIEIIETRDEIDDMLRAMAKRKTFPEDWVLNRAPAEHGGQVVAFLQDSGAARARNVWGVEIFDVGDPQRVEAPDGSFAYVIAGSGRTRFGNVIRDVEAYATSTDEFTRGKTGIDLVLAVKKAARTRLDGRLTRKLLGLDAVPASDLEKAWLGSDPPKRLDQCRRGHGFGSRTERAVGVSDREPDVEPPTCPHCKTKCRYLPAKGERGAFYGCPNWDKHRDKKYSVDAAKWIEHVKAVAPTPPSTVASGPMPSAADIFNGSREPGAEG